MFYLYDTNNIMIDKIVNILAGLILGVLIYKFYISPTIIRGPNSKEIINKTFIFNGKKYKFDPVICGCIKNKYDLKNLYL